MDNKSIITEFIVAWSRLDAAELAGYFTEDGVYYNMPFKPVKGRDNVEKFIADFLADWKQTDWEIITLMAEGDVVIAERMDRTVTETKSVDLPCTGIFEMHEGKIKVWRDYFDMATFTR